MGKKGGTRGIMIGEKVKIELAARLIGAPDRRLQNRKWAKTDAMTSAFAHYQFARHGHNLMGESPERAPIAGSA